MRKNKRGEENPCVEEKGERKEKSFDTWCFDSRKSISREIKLVNSMRATSKCQKQKR